MAKKNVGSGSGCCQEVVVVRKWLLSGREIVRVALIVRVVVVVVVPRPLAYMAGGQLLH